MKRLGRFARNAVELAVLALALVIVGAIGGRQILKDTAGPERIKKSDVRPGMLVELSGTELSRRVFAKVLVVDDEGVHVRTYEPGTSELIPRADRRVGVGHVPLNNQMWKRLGSKQLGKETVAKRELDGYREWERDPDALYVSESIFLPMYLEGDEGQ
jgi:hypothetical protein